MGEMSEIEIIVESKIFFTSGFYFSIRQKLSEGLCFSSTQIFA